MLQVTTHIESIADSCYSISGAISRKKESKNQFNTAMNENLIRFSGKISEIFKKMTLVIKDEEAELEIHEIKTLMQKIKKDSVKLREDHFKDLRKGVYKTKSGVIYADIYTELYKIADLSNQVIYILKSEEIPDSD
jgi:Na+/phosphate symporter